MSGVWCKCVHMCAHFSVGACVSDCRLRPEVDAGCLPHLLWQGLLLNLDLSFSLVLLISVSGDLQFLPSKPGITGDQCACLDFSVGSEDFNSRLHTCATGTLPTEPSPWPLLKVFETNSGHLYLL